MAVPILICFTAKETQSIKKLECTQTCITLGCDIEKRIQQYRLEWRLGCTLCSAD